MADYPNTDPRTRSLDVSAGDYNGFDGLRARSIEFEIEGILFRIANLEDLATMKRTSTRPKDRLHLAMIEEFQQFEATRSGFV